MISIPIKRTTYTTYEMNDMTVELHILIEIYLHAMTVATQVIACQIHQHHMLCILFRIIAQELSSLAVLFDIARTLSSTGNRIYEGFITYDTVVSFWRRTEDTVSTEIKIEEVW